MIKKDRNSVILGILILMQPVLDIISYFAIEAGSTTVTTLLRFAIFGLIMLYAFAQSMRKKGYFCFAGVAIVFWIIHVAVCADGEYDFIADLNGYIRTLHMPALTIAFIDLFQNSRKFPEEIGKYFGINYAVIALSIVLSFVLNKPVYTYDRWIDGVLSPVGIKGWFYTGNAQSCIISIMALLALYYAYVKKINLVFACVMLLAFAQMYFFGTRVAYLSIFITAIVFLIPIIWNREKRIFVVVALVLAIVVAGVAYPLSPMYDNRTSVNNSQDEWAEIIDSTQPDATDMDKEPGDNSDATDLDKEPRDNPDTTDPDKEPGDNSDATDLDKEPRDNLDTTDPDKEPGDNPDVNVDDLVLSAGIASLIERFGYEKVLDIYGGHIDSEEMMDSRLVKTNYGKMLMAEKSIWVKLFGCGYQDFVFSDTIFDPENDFAAIIFFYGYVGVAIYFAFIAYFAFLLIRDILEETFGKKKRMPMLKVLLGAELLLSFAIAQLSANVLRRPNVSIYISLMLAYAYCVCEQEKGE